MTRTPLIDRIDTLTPEELRRAWRATARGDRTYRAKLIADIDDDRGEVLQFFMGLLDAPDQEASARSDRRGKRGRK